MAIHPLLHKQITKHMGPQALDNPEFAAIINIISASYDTYDRDKKITEHAFQVSEKEYQDVLNNLKKEIDLKKESIQKVKFALSALDKDNESKWSDSDDLMEIIDFLNAQINIKNELEQTLLLAKENAEKAAKAKSDFLSVMSHEIRTPLNAIIGNIHILKQERHLPEQNEFITTLDISSHNLLNLINDILDFSKIEDGKVKFDKKSFSLKSLLMDIKSTNRFRADEHQNLINLNYSSQLPEYVIGDSLRLGQILNNLVSNAIKFTSNGTIDIDISLVEQSSTGLKIKFEVKDSGIGIEQEHITKVFERFTQANSNITRVHGGSGLGLAIVKKLLVLMNSDIYVNSKFGEGSVFYFTLDFQTSDQTETLAPKNAEALSETLMGVNVLLVEDVKFNIIVAKKMMESWKVNIDLAENGKEAVDKVQQKNFDVILMDLQMPIMDGITATKRIRELNIPTPIIALTASVSNDTQTEVFNSGMDDYLTKPFNPKDLFNAIKKATNRN